MPLYLSNGKKNTGPTHKHPDGSVMSGAKMSKTSKKLLRFKDLSMTAQKKARGFRKKK